MSERTVLFVDDEPNTLQALARALQGEPYSSLFAKSGYQALEILEAEAVQVIVSDIRMPRMDGLSLIKQVQQLYPHMIRLILSVKADSKVILESINKGNVYRYILKPWNNEELKLAVRQSLDLFDLQQEKINLLKKLENQNRFLQQKVVERTNQVLAMGKRAEIGKYASQIVHNLNNPLQAILAGLNLADLELSEYSSDSDELRNYLRVIKSSVYDMEKIITGILDQSRDRHLSETEPVNVNQIIQRELDFFKLIPIFKEYITKQVKLAEDLPPIQGNPTQIKQIVDNLIKNAIDAMESSEEKQLTIETWLEKDAVSIRVADTGEGIPGENLNKIFSPDFSTKPVGKGTGLGLASVKAMVEAYGGSIRVESERGRGTTFALTIPLKKITFQGA